MVEDDINPSRCRFCTSSFSIDILKKIRDDRDDVYCENCGDLVKKIHKFAYNDIKKEESKKNDIITSGKPYKDLKPHPDA